MFSRTPFKGAFLSIQKSRDWLYLSGACADNRVENLLDLRPRLFEIRATTERISFKCLSAALSLFLNDISRAVVDIPKSGESFKEREIEKVQEVWKGWKS